MQDITHEVSSLPNLTAADRHKLLETERRRRVLRLLADIAHRTTPEELASMLVSVEGQTSPDESTIERVASMLHHVDLPVMASVGILDYDPDAREIDPHGIPPTARAITSDPA